MQPLDICELFAAHVRRAPVPPLFKYSLFKYIIVCSHNAWATRVGNIYENKSIGVSSVICNALCVAWSVLLYTPACYNSTSHLFTSFEVMLASKTHPMQGMTPGPLSNMIHNLIKCLWALLNSNNELHLKPLVILFHIFFFNYPRFPIYYGFIPCLEAF